MDLHRFCLDHGLIAPVLRKKLLGIAVGSALFSLVAQASGGLQLFEWAVLDQWLRLRPLELIDSPVVIITVDDTDIAANGQWPMSDAQLTQLLTTLRSQNPTVIGLNLYRDLPISPGTEELAQVFRTTPNLIGIEKAVGKGTIPAVAPPSTLDALGQVAFNDLVLDSDGHVRRHLLSLRKNEEIQFALGTQVALIYLEEHFQITLESLADYRIRLGQAEFAPLHRHAGSYVNADVGGYQVLANYLRTTNGMTTLSMRDVLNRQVPKGLLSNKIVLIGLKADSSWGDRFYTPYTQSSSETWAGVEIHANLAAQLVAAALEGRASLNVLSEPMEWSWLFLWACLGVACNPVLTTNWRRLSRLPFANVFLVATTYFLFRGASYWLPLVAPLFTLNIAWLTTQSYLVWRQQRDEKKVLQRTVQERTQELIERNQQLEQARTDAETASQAKSNFLAHMSHELRTPLTAILGFGNLLEASQNLPKIEKEYAEIISQSGEHLLTLINNVLELSKIETGKIILKPEATHLQFLVTNVHRMFQAQAAAKQLSFNLQFVEPLPTVIEVDGGKLRQILINLLGNAMKFTQSGHINLKIQSSHSPSGDELLVGEQCLVKFVVEDTGPGFSEEETAQIFQPFVQSEAGKKQGKGTGLGLTLVRQYLERMGGDIQVSSFIGEGSQFSFQLPVQILQLSNPLSSSDSSSVDKSDLLQKAQNYRVLVVDDDSNNRHLLSQWLANAQFDIQVTDNGVNALRIFSNWNPHLILLDVHLPDVDGYEVARRIRENWAMEIREDSETSWLEMDGPVILAITAGVLQDKYADLLAAGCDDVIWKPLRSETLLDKMQEYL